MVMVLGKMTVVGDDNSNNNDPYEIIITGLDGKDGNNIWLMISTQFIIIENVMAHGQGIISNSSVTISLFGYQDIPYRRDDQYYVIFLDVNNDVWYYYTKGKTFFELGYTAPVYDHGRVPKYNITGPKSIIEFKEFTVFN